jgi:hypothetical protein
MCLLGAKIQSVPSPLTGSNVTVLTILHYHIMLTHYLIIITHYHIMLTYYHTVLPIILQIVKLNSSCIHCHPSNFVIFEKKKVDSYSTCIVFALYAVLYISNSLPKKKSNFRKRLYAIWKSNKYFKVLLQFKPTHSHKFIKITKIL